MIPAPVVDAVLRHYRVVCPECFDVAHECPCGRPEIPKDTHWTICEICMKKNPKYETLAVAVPPGLLLDAQLVFQKIMPIMDYPKEFIPERLFPGYDQWKEKVLSMILNSGAAHTNELKTEGAANERRKETADPGAAHADQGGNGGDAASSPGEDQKQ